MIVRFRLLTLVVLGLSAAAIRGDEPKLNAVRPAEVIRLFNGRDLGGLSTWLKDSENTMIPARFSG